MHLSNYLDDVVVWAPAKVNFFLEVLGKRPDGFHEIATLMVALRLYDTLIIRMNESPEITLTCSMTQLSTGPDNLVMRAAKLLQDRTGCKRGARIRLIKRIPLAAGLAGGSTDAAAALLGLNKLWRLDLAKDELAKFGAELGSDIPFFFHTPAAWCTGRGENVTALKMNTPFDVVLLCPSFGMPTAAVYKNVMIPATPVSGEAILQGLAQGDVDRIGRLLHNRLQPAAERLDARMAHYDRLLAEQNPAGHLMSGSGSTLYALCRSPQEGERLVEALKGQSEAGNFKLILTRSL